MNGSDERKRNAHFQPGIVQFVEKAQNQLKPEVKLSLWVLIQSARDVHRGKKDAIEFFESGDFEGYFDIVQTSMPAFTKDAVQQLLESPDKLHGRKLNDVQQD